MMFKSEKTIGYAQLYFKIVGKNKTYYAAFDGDFVKPLIWFRLNRIKRSMRKVYEKFDKIYSVEFCSKEEWKEKIGAKMIYAIHQQNQGKQFIF